MAPKSAKSASNAASVAKLFGVSDRTIWQLAREGVIPPAIDGQFDLPKCVMAYVAHLKDQRSILSARELGEVMGLTEAAVLKLARNEPDFKGKISQGKYHVPTVIQWYVAKFKRKAIGQDTNDLSEETLLHKREQRLMAQIERQKMQRELVPRQEAEDGYASLCGLFVSEIDAMPGRLAPVVVNAEGPDEARQMILKEIRRVRQYIADELRKITEAIRGDGGDDS